MAGRGLGTLTLDLAIRMGAFEKGLDKAGRDLDKATKAMHARAEKLGKSIGNALKIGFGIGAAAVGLYIRNTIEAEKVQAQLAARIKDTGAAAGRTLQQLSAQADKLQSLTIFDDEAIGEAQAALLVFKDVQGLNFDRTIEAATDLATVMGTDVADAAKLLGKALSDPIAGIGALRKAGIVLTEDQKFLIKAFQESGDVASAQGIILDQLADTMGSAAEAARNTLGGALEGLKNSFNNMLEGDSGSDGVRGATEAINELSDQMNSADVKAGFNAIVSGLAAVAKFALQAAAALTANSEANRQAGLDNAQRSYEGLLARRTEATDALKQNFLQRGIGDAFSSADKLKAEIADIDQRLEAARQKMRQAENQPRRPAPNTFASDGTVTITADPDLFGSRPASGGHSGADKAAREREAAAREAERLAKEAAEANKEFLDGLQDMRDELAGPLAQALTDHNRRLAELDKLAKEGKVTSEQLKEAQDAETALYEKRREEIEKTLNPLADVVEAQERQLALMGLTGAALEAESVRLGATAEQWAKYGDAITENALNIEEQQKAIDAADNFRSHWEDAFAAIFDRSKSIKEAFSDLAKSIMADIARMLAKQWVEKLFGAFGSSFGGSFGGGSGGSLPSLGDFGGSAKGNAFIHGVPVHAFANGGIVNSPTIFPMARGMGLMGEAGPEAVMPLTRDGHGRLGVRGGGGLVVNQVINVAGRPDERTASQIAQRTGERSSRALSRNR